MERITIKNRNSLYDCAKGIGILFVVMGHVAALGNSFYTKFHVLFFFVFAGLMVKVQTIESISDVYLYIKKIWIRYALPYFLCNTFFILFFNIFVKYHVITSDIRISHISLLSIQDIISKVFGFLFLYSSSEQLCGATWFLRSLFWGLLVFILISYVNNKIGRKKLLNNIFLCIAIIIALMVNNRIFLLFLQSLICIILGDTLKPVFIKIKNDINTVLLLGILFLSFFMIILVKYINVAIICSMLYAILGFVFIYYFAIFIKKYLSFFYEILVYVGQHTLSILCFHLFCFKIVSYIYIQIYSLNIIKLGDFPIITQPYMFGIKISYIIIGVVFPLFLEFVYKNFKKWLTHVWNK